jgi:hypothetical protein
VHGIEPPERGIFRFAALRPAMVVRQRQRNDFALLDEPRRRDDILRPRVIERANLVLRAQRPQFFSRSAAAWMSAIVSLRADAPVSDIRPPF